MTRTDDLLKTTKALPAAAASNNHDGIDLGATTPGPTVREVVLQVAIPATPALVSAKTITLTVQDSADNSTFAAVEELAPLVVTGGGSGGDATTYNYKLPENVKRYVRINQAVLTAGGDNTGVSVTAKILT